MMNYKTVNNRFMKGIILTAESLMQLEDDLRMKWEESEALEGALEVVKFLKECYKKIE